MESDLDSIIHEHPTLSPKYINYTRQFWNLIKAEKLAQASNYLPDRKLPKVVLDEIVEKYWKHLPRPYTAYCGEFSACDYICCNSSWLVMALIPITLHSRVLPKMEILIYQLRKEKPLNSISA